eukprot:COSAG06_NODE_51792_length_310_cov_0.260664_1_plen_33_part_01
MTVESRVYLCGCRNIENSMPDETWAALEAAPGI